MAAQVWTGLPTSAAMGGETERQSMRLSINKSVWIVRTQCNGRRRRRAEGGRCLVCEGTGKVDCHDCRGKGRSNWVDLQVLPKGDWPRWCRCCGGSGLAFCSRCLGSGDYRYVMGFRFINPPPNS